MSIKVARKWFRKKNDTPFQKLPKNVGDVGKLIVAKAFKACPKSNKSPNLVTLDGSGMGLTTCCACLSGINKTCQC